MQAAATGSSVRISRRECDSDTSQIVSLVVVAVYWLNDFGADEVDADLRAPVLFVSG
jgi:hypothetical protein